MGAEEESFLFEFNFNLCTYLCSWDVCACARVLVKKARKHELGPTVYLLPSHTFTSSNICFLKMFFLIFFFNS